MPKHLISGALLFFLATPTVASCASTPAPTSPPPGSALEEVLRSVQDGLQRAQNTLALRELPPLKSVELTLHTQVDQDAGGKIKIFVISIGGGASKANAQEIVLTLVPPPASPRMALAANTVSEQLVALIQEAASCVKAAAEGPVPLSAESATIEIDLVLKKEGNAGVKFEIAPVSAELGGNLKRQLVQKVKVSFKTK